MNDHLKTQPLTTISTMDRINASALMMVTPESSHLRRLRAASGYQPSKPTFPTLYPLPLKSVKLNGTTVRYAHSPAEGKPTLVLLCPLPQSIQAYAPIWEGLAEYTNLFAYDLPGFGHSEGGTEYMNFKAQGEFLGAFLEHFEIEGAHLLGPDIGMPTILYHVGAGNGNTAKVKSILVGDGPAIEPSSNGSIIDKMVYSAFWRRIMTIAGGGALVEAGNRVGYVNYVPNTEEISDYKNAYAKRMDIILKWFEGYPQSLAQVDPLLEGIQVPTLIFWGENDELLKLDNGERLHKRLPNSTLHVFSNCGHFSYQDAHEEFQKMVLSWIKEHP